MSVRDCSTEIFSAMLATMSQADRLRELRQLFVNLMDYTEQSAEEELYVALEDVLEDYGTH